jgi:Cu+-exporting ATPase
MQLQPAELKVPHASMCKHCGQYVENAGVAYAGFSFCCTGCKLVYELLSEKGLCDYYGLNEHAGNKVSAPELGNRYAFLSEPEVANRLVYFRQNNEYRVRLHLPAMHCSSCIWLLEHLKRIDDGVMNSRVDFVRREIDIAYDPMKTGLRHLVETLHAIGYPPELNMKQGDPMSEVQSSEKRRRWFRIGLAGFAFGNSMLLSFPEYLSGGISGLHELRELPGFSVLVSALNLILGLLVILFSASEFLGNALLAIRQRRMNMDVPIAIGIVAMFFRTVYEIISGTGPGYTDSMSGLVFFMLIGRNVQNGTFRWLSFERDYRSYFPLSVSVQTDGQEQSKPVQLLKTGDRMVVRSQEIIPADALLSGTDCLLDYSFITGESRPVELVRGQQAYAGARLLSDPREFVVLNPVSVSHLTSLWNNATMRTSKVESGFSRLTQTISTWFIVSVLAIAAAAFTFWYLHQDAARGIHALTSVLVIACACALVLSGPFMYGNLLRLLGKRGIYLKDAATLERLADIDSIAFDKTGTLTERQGEELRYMGQSLSSHELAVINQLAAASHHPLGRMLHQWLKRNKPETIEFTDLREYVGMGMEACFNGKWFRIGKPEFVAPQLTKHTSEVGTKICVGIDGAFKGSFVFSQRFRESTSRVINFFKKNGYRLSVLSGDNDSERASMRSLFGSDAELKFGMSPHDKLFDLHQRANQGEKVMMVGDGLNDAGAFMSSHVGIALVADINTFSPGCDAIVLDAQFDKLPDLLKLAKFARSAVIASFFIALVYNVVGLSYAVQGDLSPVIAAILMPISTTSLVLFTVLSGSLYARSLGLYRT